MLTNSEKAIIQILQILNIKKDTIIGIMLMLKDNKEAHNLLITFLKNSDPMNLNEGTILNKIKELIKTKKETKEEIIDHLIQMPNMDKPTMRGILHYLKTEEQAKKMLNWLKEQNLKTLKNTPTIEKVHEIAEN